jgi:ribulose 1,5-bisphosphate carboxylase large subunit-like protein
LEYLNNIQRRDYLIRLAMKPTSGMSITETAHQTASTSKINPQ